jgi:hypothetical protein
MSEHHKKRGVSGLFRGQRAQITVFMIVGIILLFSTSLLFYIRGQIVEGIPEEFVPTLEEVPLEAQPIKIYVEDCIARIGREAIEEIGLHGGYVDPRDTEMSGTAFAVGMEPTESDAIILFDEAAIIPYWWYLKSPNTCSGNCRFDTKRPPLRKTESLYSIESQLDRYINTELDFCLADFEVFTEQGFDIEILGDIDADSMVTEKDISIVVEYPIKATRQEQSTEITRFFTRLDINFKEIYEMATAIADKEAKTAFLETHTMNVITMYSMPLSVDRLPPLTEFTMDPTEFLFWTTTETKQRLEQYALPNTASMLQVNQARNFKRVIMFERNDEGELEYDAIGTGIMDTTVLFLDKNFTDLEARFMYLDLWPVYLNINDKEVLMPTKIDMPVINWMGLNQYVFMYSLAYPVLVTLTDPDAFLGDGYDFVFALEHNIRYNEPINVTDVTVFAEQQGSLVCSPDQKKGELTTIEVQDEVTGEPIEGVRVSLVFGSEGCDLGVTEIDENNRSTIKTALPAGAGELRATHLDYLEYSEQFFSNPSRQQNATIELMPFRFINVSVFARPLHYQNYSYTLPLSAPLSSLLSKEQYIIVFERQDEDGNQGYSAFAQGTGPAMSEMKIIPGTYNVRGTLLLDEEIIIPKESKEYDPSIFLPGKTVTVNETVLEKWQEGGVTLNNDTGLFVVPRDKLFNSKKLNMFVLRFPKPVTHTTDFRNAPSLEQAGDLEYYSNIYRTDLEPEWIQ